MPLRRAGSAPIWDVVSEREQPFDECSADSRICADGWSEVPLEDLAEKVVPLLAHRRTPGFRRTPQLCARNRQLSSTNLARTATSLMSNVLGRGDQGEHLLPLREPTQVRELVVRDTDALEGLDQQPDDVGDD
jgi:hypothetical protein